MKTIKRNNTDRFSKKLALAIAAIVAGAAPASAFNIDFTYQPGMTEDQITAVEMAGLYWESLLKDDINVELHVGSASNLQVADLDLGTDTLGLAIPGFTEEIDYKTAATNLTKDKSSQDDKTALNNLNKLFGKNSYSMLVDGEVESGDKIRTTYANAMAGSKTSIYDDKLHGAVIFNDDASINWSDDDEIGADETDLVSTIAHEIGHNLGFVSGVGIQGEEHEFRTTLDMFRYSDDSIANKAIEFTKGADSFFTIDGTPVADFANGVEEGASHWKEGEIGIMEGHNLLGTRLEAEDIDLKAFDVIGYDLSGNTDVDWAELRAEAEGKLEEGVTEVDRAEDVEAMLAESGFSAARPPYCPPYCGQELAQEAAVEAEAVPEPATTAGLLGLTLAGAVGYLFKGGKKDVE